MPSGFRLHEEVLQGKEVKKLRVAKLTLNKSTGEEQRTPIKEEIEAQYFAPEGAKVCICSAQRVLQR